VTLWPFLARAMAAASPPSPAPTMMMLSRTVESSAWLSKLVVCIAFCRFISSFCSLTRKSRLPVGYEAVYLSISTILAHRKEFGARVHTSGIWMNSSLAGITPMTGFVAAPLTATAESISTIFEPICQVVCCSTTRNVYFHALLVSLEAKMNDIFQNRSDKHVSTIDVSSTPNVSKRGVDEPDISPY
jgi:hypothetical protein